MPQALEKPPSNARNLRLRIVSALVMAPAVLGIAYGGGWFYASFVTCVVALGFYEWARLVSPAVPRVARCALCALIAGLVALAKIVDLQIGIEGIVCVTFLAYLLARFRQWQSPVWIAFGLPYMAGSGIALLYLRGMPAVGRGLVFFLLAAVWGTDIGGYVVGRAIGGAKLAPSISPGKTWAGFFGGMALAGLFGYLCCRAFDARRPEIGAGLALVLAVVAQIGDLFESYVKRRSGVKESGDLIPGHGGILDRIDGLVFAALFAAAFQAAIGEWINWW